MALPGAFLNALLSGLLLSSLLFSCQSGESSQKAAKSANTISADSLEVEKQFDALAGLLTPFWGKSPYWDDWPFEECSYYGSTTNSAGERTYFDWFIRVNKRQEGDGQGFVVSHYSPRDSCHAVYRYERSSLTPRGKANQLAAQEHFSHHSINFALRALAFSPGKTHSLPIEGSAPASLHILEGEELYFQDESYDCYLLLLQLNGKTDSLWYDKQYPNRLVRVADGNNRLMLKSVVRR